MNFKSAVLLILAAVALFVTGYSLQARKLWQKVDVAQAEMRRNASLVRAANSLEAAAHGHEATLRGCLLGRPADCEPGLTRTAQTLRAAAAELATFADGSSAQKAEVTGILTEVERKIRLVLQVWRTGSQTSFHEAAACDMRLHAAVTRLEANGGEAYLGAQKAYARETRSCYIFSLAAFLVLAAGTGITLYRIYQNARERSEVEGIARTTEAHYRMLVEGSDLVLIVTNPHGIITFASDNVTSLTGYPCDALVGQRLDEFLGVGEMDDSQPTGREREHTFVNAAGEERWAAYRIKAERDKDGSVTEYRIVAWDIDREKRMRMTLQGLEDSRRQQQQLFQDVIDNVPNMVYLKDLKGNYIVVNRHMRELFGTQDVIGRRLMDLLGSQEDEDRMRRADQQVLKDQQPVAFEEFYVVEGEERYFWEVKFPVFDEHGDVAFIGGIATDITTRKREEIALREAKGEAEHAKQAQEAFMAAMSHEIRTPMNGIVGMANLMAGTKLNAEQREFTDTILESARNLLSIINDLLDFSKIESGRFEFERTPFRLRHALKKAVHPLRFKAEEKGLKLELDVDDNTPEVLVGDPLRLQQIVINLVGNAIKFTGEGSVTVAASAIAAGSGAVMLQIDVKDTGIGIPQDKLGYVFESFTQQHSAISRSYGGTGLGLAIVRQLAELQGGNVEVHSESGMGSTFTVSIPFEVSNEIPAVAPRRVPGPGTVNGMLVGLSILVAEDNPINQKVVRNTLAKQGADVTIVENGQLAVDLLIAGAARYDAVLMDLQMPEMDGYEATRRIRQELHSDIPIIAMTADALKGEDERTKVAGMTGFVSKPFEPDDLYQKILALTSGRVSSPGLLPVAGAVPSVSAIAQGIPLVARHDPLVDLSYLTDLSGDDPAYLRDVVGIFLGSVPQSLEHLDKLVHEGTNKDAIRKTAHGLKSSFGVIRVEGFLEALAELEHLTDGPDGQAGMARVMDKLTHDFQLAKEELQAVMASV